jgi:DNA-binding GntR family transcriptional regulator
MIVATQRVADHLRRAILGGTIAPGERVRQEALQMLAAEGLVEHEPNKGARVPWLSMHEVDVMYKMREQLEPLALGESLPLLTPGDLLRLDEIQDEIESGVDVERFLALDREFHLRTYSACAIDQLTTTVTRLWNSTQYYRRAFMQLTGPSRRWVVNAEHRLLIDAVERRDEIDAGRILAGHIRRTRIELLRHPEVFGED